MDKLLGKRLDGRYEIIELVGVGGMANVYRATDVTSGRSVAVKVLREEFVDNEEFLRRFKNESKAIAVLSHPNIVKVYDVNFTDKVNYIVMEYIDGITLKEYIEQQHVLRWKEAVHFTVQILRALQHAHDKGIVHRDVKPQNIMLLSDGSIKVTDFGIARFARSGMSTITDRAIGSVHYISPEQARGEPTDGKSDIYSVGIMLYEMLTGQLPFDAQSAVSVALKQIQAQPKQPRELNPSIPEGLEEITIRAMEKDPRRRYQTASEMLRDIDEFKRNPSISFEYKYMDSTSQEEEKYQAAIRSSRHVQGSKQRGSLNSSKSKEKQTSMLKSKKNADAPKRSPKSRKSSSSTEERTLPVVPILGGITAAFVVGSLIFIFTMVRLNNPFERVPDVTVPTLVGLKYDTVRTSENYSNFLIEMEGDPVYNDEYEAGVIIEQKPAAGRTVKPNSKITVKVSAGQEIITLPNYVGQEATSVFAQLRDLNLEYQQVDVFSSTVASGLVAATEPGAGSEIPAGTVVRVQVSMGPDSKVVPVPDLGGMSLEDARAALEEAGLSVGNIEYKDSEAESGTVIGQNPGPTSQISEGGYVNLTVSSGDEIIQQVSLYVRLPENLSSVITIKAMQDGVVVQEQQIQPSLVRVWKPSFTGQGTANVQIIIDNRPYMEYTIDFDAGTSTQTADYSADFES